MMFGLPLTAPRRVLCLGAHSDDIEIGCGAAVSQISAAHPDTIFHWVVFSAEGDREREARAGANRFLAAACQYEVVVKHFRDGFFPFQGAEIKECFEELKAEIEPDLIFTHYRADRHQDHRLISDLTWNTFRNHLVLEYEVPKYDGDLGSPNCYFPFDEAACRRKTDLLLQTFQTQQTRCWFTPDTFRGLMRIRGIESGSPGGFAEAFYAHKVVLAA